MLILIKNAVTGGIIGTANTTAEARRIAESKGQPYVLDEIKVAPWLR